MKSRSGSLKARICCTLRKCSSHIKASVLMCNPSSANCKKTFEKFFLFFYLLFLEICLIFGTNVYYAMIEMNKKGYERLDEEIHNFVSEQMVEFNLSKPEIPLTFDVFLENKLLVVKTIKAGLPYSFFEVIRENAPFSESDWADFLDISTKTLQRYKTSEDHLFKSIYSEKIIELAEVTKIGMDVFGTTEKIELWLNTPNYALGNVLPKTLLKDSYGKELVVGELVRINHGILV